MQRCDYRMVMEDYDPNMTITCRAVQKQFLKVCSDEVAK